MAQVVCTNPSVISQDTQMGSEWVLRWSEVMLLHIPAIPVSLTGRIYTTKSILTEKRLIPSTTSLPTLRPKNTWCIRKSPTATPPRWINFQIAVRQTRIFNLQAWFRNESCLFLFDLFLSCNRRLIWKNIRGFNNIWPWKGSIMNSRCVSPVDSKMDHSYPEVISLTNAPNQIEGLLSKPFYNHGVD